MLAENGQNKAAGRAGLLSSLVPAMVGKSRRTGGNMTNEESKEMEVKDSAVKTEKEVEKEKELEPIILDEKGRCENSVFECQIIYRLASGLSGVREPATGKWIVPRRLDGQPAYAFGKIKDKLRRVVEDLEEARTFSPESQPSKYGQKLNELKSEYGRIDGNGGFTFYEGTTEDERVEFRRRLKELKKEYPNVEEEIDRQNRFLRALGKQRVIWEPHKVDIEPQLGKLSPDEWEWFGRTDKDGEFLFLKGKQKDLTDALETYQEDERRAKKRGE